MAESVVAKTAGWITKWGSSGQEECRRALAGLEDEDTAAAVWQTLHFAALPTLAGSASIDGRSLVSFAQSTLHARPSSSQDVAPSMDSVRALSDLLIDAVWATDAALDEQTFDVTTRLATLAADGPADAEKEGKLQALKARLEKDKESLVEVVTGYLKAGIMDPAQARERLDLALIISTGLIANKANYDRREIRTRTGLFYKQIKFNLSREQSEGFSKLLAEVTSSLPLAHSTLTGRPHESTATMLEQAAPVWDHLFSVIGYFEMDPNRALDIILDVFSTHVATHWSFFLALLHLSPWKGNSSRLHWTGEGDVSERHESPATEERYRGKTLDEVLILAEGDHAPPPPPSEDEIEPQARVMAQILGFKFRHYQDPNTKEPAPGSLYAMTALLLREGFIGLDELYPHLSPSDEDMEEKEHQTYKDSVEKRKSAGAVNKLAMTGALEGGVSSKPRAPEPKKEAPVEDKKPATDANQKVGLVTALLAVGALRPALAILSKFPWLKDAHPAIADLLLRVTRHALSGLYDQRYPPKIVNKASYTQARARFGPAGPQPAPPRKRVLTLTAPTPPATSQVEYVFYFPDWAERVPVCASEGDFVDVIEPLLAFVQFHVSRDLLFMTKFSRLGRKQLLDHLEDPVSKKLATPDMAHPIVAFWVKVIRLYLIPALSLVRGNAVACVDVWGILRFFDAAERWRFYGEWNTTIYRSSGELQVRHRQAERESKAIMRRLAHDTVDSLQTSVAKLAHSNPCIIFSIAVNQAMAYPNMAEVIIKSLKFVLNMGFDVLMFTVISILANPGGRERYKPDGVHASDWLQNLAKFVGMMLARYNVDPTALLQYVMHQFRADEMSEAIVVRELVERMSSIEPLPSLSDAQVRIMSGGPHLRIEAVASRTRGARSDPQDQAIRAPMRLVRYLLESGMARPLLVQIAQLRQQAAHKAQNMQLKSVASLFDSIHGVFLQYLELLQSSSAIKVEQYAAEISPPLAELGDLYDISAPMCMQIVRPLLAAAVKQTATEYQLREKWENEQAEKRLAERLKAREEKKSKETTPGPASANAADAAASTLTRANGETAPTKAADGDVDMQPAEEPSQPPSKYAGPWIPRLEAFFGDVSKIVPPVVLDTLGAGFYLTFWQMTASDLGVPDDKYHEEMRNLQAYADEELKEYQRKERVRVLRAEASAHWQRHKRAKDHADMLNQELKDLIDMRQFIIKRLAKEHPVWFASDRKAALVASVAVEHCILPRALLSPMDAEYAAQMIRAMHSLGTHNWHTLKVYDLLLGEQVRAMTFSCSEYEARNYGRFLCAILKTLNAWYDSQSDYDKAQAKWANGKAVAHIHGMRRTYKALPADQSDHTPWADFQKLVRKWHRNLSACLKDCILTDEYMHVYNAMIVLKEILPVFPLLTIAPELGRGIDAPVKALLDKELLLAPDERRNDIITITRAYHSALHKQESKWLPKSATKPRESAARTSSASQPASSAATNGVATTQAAPTSTVSQSKGTVNGEKAIPTPPPSARSIDSVPRPEVVRRVQRPDAPSQPASNGDGRSSSTVNAGPSGMPSRPQSRDPHAMSAPVRPLREAIRPVGAPRLDMRSDIRQDFSGNVPPLLRSASGSGRDSGRITPTMSSPMAAPPLSPRSRRTHELRRDGPGMPPPVVPSQTPSAQELRETARQTLHRKTEEQAMEEQDAEERPLRAPPTEPRHGNTHAPPPSSTRRRSQSPATRPGTRNGSTDSRASGERARELERSDSRASEGLVEARGSERRRERTSTREEREKERGRDRHGERERKERGEREPREKERGGEREREGYSRSERHRREEKEREAVAPPDAPRRDRMPAEVDAADDASGVKRRRAGDEEPDRVAKRSRDKDKREREKSKRATAEEKEKDHDRPRRREREGVESDKMAAASYLPSSTPSAPRAMAGDLGSRTRSDPPPLRERDRARDVREHAMREHAARELPQLTMNDQSSLLARISTNRGDGQRIPQGPRSSGGGGGEPPWNYERPDPPYARRSEGSSMRSDAMSSMRSDALPFHPNAGVHRTRDAPGGPRLNDMFELPPSRQSQTSARADEQETRRKRTVSDRERDSPVADPSISNPEPPQQTKRGRPRLDRTRYKE